MDTAKYIFEQPWIIVLFLIWTLPWKAAALWRSARRGHLGWFLMLLILQTFAILDIVYIFFFSGSAKKQETQNIAETATPREPRVGKIKKEEMLQKQLLQKEIELQELEAKQARYAEKAKKRINVV